MKIGVNALKLSENHNHASTKKRYNEPNDEQFDEHPLKNRRRSDASDFPNMIVDPDLDLVEMRSNYKMYNKYDMLDSKNTLKLSKPLFQNPLSEMEN